MSPEDLAVIDCGDAGAIFLVRHRVRGAVSGAEVERDEVHFWRTLDEARAVVQA